MKLTTVARRADKTPCYDSYTGLLAFNGQLLAYDESKRDSETAERRILSLGPLAVIPTRRCVNIAGKNYIVGAGNDDLYRGEVIRVGYVTHEAVGLASVKTLLQAVQGAAGIQAYVGVTWIKNMAYSEQNSLLVPQVHVHLSSTEPATAGMMVVLNGIYYLIRAIYYGAGGTLSAVSDQLPTPVREAGVQVSTGVFDPVADTTSTSTTTTNVLRVRWQSLFQYGSNAAPKFGPEDIQLVIDKAVAVKPGSQVTLSDGKWIIASALDEGPVWLCRATRHE